MVQNCKGFLVCTLSYLCLSLCPIVAHPLYNVFLPIHYLSVHDECHVNICLSA